MTKRPSLFAALPDAVGIMEPTDDSSLAAIDPGARKQPASRVGKRVLSVYLDPLAWKQLRQLALERDTTTQALGEEAVNLLFTKHGLNRSA